MNLITIALSFAIYYFLGLPVAFALILVSFLILYFLVGVDIVPMTAIAQRMLGGIDSFVLVAVPMFILAGKAMNIGKVTDKIFDFANSIVGHIKGGYAHVNILASLIFAGMSGSAVADASGLGEIEIKAMRKKGYDDTFSAAITAVSSINGPIFPPSITMVVFGGLAGVSIGKLFVAGIVPGVAMATFLMITAYFVAKKRNYPSGDPPSLTRIWYTFKRGFWPLLAPIIILSSIIFGIATPTEAATIAAIYSIVLGFLYGNIHFKDLPGLFIDTGEATAKVLFLVSAVSLFAWSITFERIPHKFVSLITSYISEPWLAILATILILLFIGAFMNPTPGLILTIPFLVPLANVYNINLVHFGLICVVVLCVGFLTPPVGMCLYVVAGISEVKVGAILKELIPYFIALIIWVIFVAYFPGVILFLPNLLF